MDYKTLQKHIYNIQSKCNAKIKIIGKSVLNKNIYAITFCNNPHYHWAIITAGIHAREHLSSDLVIKQIYQYTSQNGSYSYNIAFVPLINPDGADLAVNGLLNISNHIKQKLININGSKDFTLYKSNANGVDLNNNFDANWQNKFTTKTSPSSQGFYGIKPFSEPESCVLAKFTQKLKPFIAISYHLKGEEIYFDFFQNEKNYIRDKKIANIFAQSTGYSIKSTQHASSGGYKDWCVQKLKICALTIELGSDKFLHPYPESQLTDIYNKNKGIFNCIQQSLKIYNMENFYGTNETSISTS